jgi:hypothetical protein
LIRRQASASDLPFVSGNSAAAKMIRP